MDLLKFVSVKLTLFLILGILIGYYFDFGLYLPFLLTLAFLSILGFLHFRQKRGNPIIFGSFMGLTALSLGILLIGLSQPKNANDHYSHQDLDKPALWKLKILEVLKPSAYSERYIAKVQGLNTHKASGKIILSYPKDSPAVKLQVDNELFAFTKANAIKPPLNPYQFDYRDYMGKLGVYDQIRLTPDNYFLSENPSSTLMGHAGFFRTKIGSKLRDAGFGADEFGVIQALFLGQRDDISETTYTHYKNAGAVHILAVSGLHIGILLLFLQFLLRPLEVLPKGKTIKLLVIVLLLWGFAFLAGLSASVTRAVTMFSFVAYALYLNRPGNTFNILALSMFFILLVDPMLLFDVGFQMSYAAVFAIVWIYPLLQRFWYPKNGVARRIWQLLSVSIAAQVGVLPISLYYFHQFPGLFFVSNLLIVPFLGLILGLGIIVIALVLSNLAPDSLIQFYNSVIGLMNSIIARVAQQEAFIFRNIPFDSIQMVLTYCLFIALVRGLTKPAFKQIMIFLVCVLGLQSWSLYVNNATEKKESVLIGHQIKNTLLLNQQGNRLTLFSSDSIPSKRIAVNYQIAERIKKIKTQPLQNAYKIHDKNLVIVDSSGIYTPGKNSVDYVLLTQSPKINLERLIDSLRPKQLIADGSNYTSYIKRWGKTCAHKKVPFHHTGEKGAYFFDLDKN